MRLCAALLVTSLVAGSTLASAQDVLGDPAAAQAALLSATTRYAQDIHEIQRTRRDDPLLARVLAHDARRRFFDAVGELRLATHHDARAYVWNLRVATALTHLRRFEEAANEFRIVREWSRDNSRRADATIDEVRALERLVERTEREEGWRSVYGFDWRPPARTMPDMLQAVFDARETLLASSDSPHLTDAERDFLNLENSFLLFHYGDWAHAAPRLERLRAKYCNADDPDNIGRTAWDYLYAMERQSGLPNQVRYANDTCPFARPFHFTVRTATPAESRSGRQYAPFVAQVSGGHLNIDLVVSCSGAHAAYEGIGVAVSTIPLHVTSAPPSPPVAEDLRCVVIEGALSSCTGHQIASGSFVLAPAQADAGAWLPPEIPRNGSADHLEISLMPRACGRDPSEVCVQVDLHGRPGQVERVECHPGPVYGPAQVSTLRTTSAEVVVHVPVWPHMTSVECAAYPEEGTHRAADDRDEMPQYAPSAAEADWPIQHPP